MINSVEDGEAINYKDTCKDLLQNKIHDLHIESKIYLHVL